MYHEGRADIGGTEYDGGMTSSTRRASRMGERHDAPAETPRRKEEREKRGAAEPNRLNWHRNQPAPF